MPLSFFSHQLLLLSLFTFSNRPKTLIAFYVNNDNRRTSYDVSLLYQVRFIICTLTLCLEWFLWYVYIGSSSDSLSVLYLYALNGFCDTYISTSVSISVLYFVILIYLHLFQYLCYILWYLYIYICFNICAIFCDTYLSSSVSISVLHFDTLYYFCDIYIFIWFILVASIFLSHVFH